MAIPLDPSKGQGPLKTSGRGSRRSRGKRVPVPAGPSTRKEPHKEIQKQADNVHEDQQVDRP